MSRLGRLVHSHSVKVPVHTDFRKVTELTGAPISFEQLDRLVNRYNWAASYCLDKDVVEAGCGVGAGLGLLASAARTLQAGDYAAEILEVARSHYGDRVSLREFDAQHLPFADSTKDVVILFEAIYYLPHPERFISECARVLRSDGFVLLASANKDVWDFHPSLHSCSYFGVAELGTMLARFGFECTFFGFQRIDLAPLRQRLLRPLKRAAVASGLMPRTMQGKRWLKRLVFGREIPMPAEITVATGSYAAPQQILSGQPDRRHKVIYCAGRRSLLT
jgi:SAM-dependent methyltransferase